MMQAFCQAKSYKPVATVPVLVPGLVIGHVCINTEQGIPAIRPYRFYGI
jgi:hypothetical protein